jgi:hypothetical protein
MHNQVLNINSPLGVGELFQINQLSICIRTPKVKSTRGVSHCGLAIHIKKYVKAKEELLKLKYFTMQKYNLQKTPLKETKILQGSIKLCN